MKLEDRYEIRIRWSDEDGVFVARIPDMPFAGAHGDTHEEALANAKEAFLCTSKWRESSVSPSRNLAGYQPRAMVRFEYDNEANALYIYTREIPDGAVRRQIEIQEGVLLDADQEGRTR